MYEFFVQAIGFIGAGLLIFSYQCKTNRQLFFLQLCSDFIYTSHFFLLGAYTGCISLALSFLANLVLYNNHKRWALWRGWKWVFGLLYVISTMLTWEGPFSLLPCVAMLTANFTNWSRNGKIIRLSRLLIASPGWLIYNIHSRSYSGILCESFSICSILISIFRYGIKNLDQIS